MSLGSPLRTRFGEGELAFEPARSVFINCPFDSRYSALFDAIVFATVCCDFMPRSALESGTVAEPRLARITRAVFSSRYSIHDLSRCTGEGDENFARFNMPLELGMAMARRFMDKTDEHDWLVLVPQGHAYLRFMSDLAAYDPATHDGSVECGGGGHGVALHAKRRVAFGNAPGRIERLTSFQGSEGRIGGLVGGAASLV